MTNFSSFTGLYPISKTLRFELIPQGRTLEHIQKKGFLDKDELRAESYLLVKKIIDEYHKNFISRALEGMVLVGIDEYVRFFGIQARSEEEKKIFEEVKSKLRKQIAERFTKHEDYKNLFAKELIREVLKGFVKTVEELELVQGFGNFTTYFTGFHENRKNIYSDEEKATALAYRLIHENLPRFLDNVRSFEKISESSIREKLNDLLGDSQLGPVVQVSCVGDMFTADFFNETLTQTGIDRYNHLIGGYVPVEGQEKIKGLNEYINLHNQTARKEERLPKLKPLYKQILSDRMTASYIPEQFTGDDELLETIEKFYQDINAQVINKNVKGENSLKSLLQNIPNFDLNGIFLRNDLGLTDISQKAFGDWSVIQKGIDYWFDKNYQGKAKQGTERYLEEQKKYSRSQSSFSIGFLDECLKLQNGTSSIGIREHFALLGKTADVGDLFERIETNYKSVVDLLNNSYPQDKNLAQDKVSVERLKIFLDSIKELQWFIKPLLGNGDEAGKDERFYGEFSAHWNTLDTVTPIYSKVRNYLTRKPYSTEKMKLNFENSTLLDGWDVNKESDNTSLIFRRGELFFLGIMDSKHNRIFKGKIDQDGGASYEKMEYKLLPGANKMLPKVFFSKSRIDEFAPSAKLMENYKNETHKKGASFNLNDCHDLIDFFKAAIQKHEDWKNFGFNFSNTSSYDNLSGFYREVEQQGYKISFRSIPESYINEMVDEGNLYLFQIYNKDFSANSKGTPNLHTLYWKMVFDAGNLKDVVYKLNGQAEVFYRKSSIRKENQIIHEAYKTIANKNDFNARKQSQFSYDIIKDRRYTLDKFQFHVPLTMNFKARGTSNIIPIANKFLKENTNVHVIGIDRGERHLLYLTLIDQNGNIIHQYSLNEIVNEYNGQIYRTDYHHLLDQKEGTREEARRSWKTIETIKDLKEGYLSQVINKITQLMVKHNAIVVLEDLNTGFMRGRQKVEKQVYQKFEKMLIDKLNFLVDKKKSPAETGGTLKAYQLSNQFESFKKMGKQNGFLFYVPAWNTSKMDPVTGFVNLFDTRYENVEKAKAFFGKFKAVRFNPGKDYFEFEFDYSDFTTKAEGSRTSWTLCTNQGRIETFPNPEKNTQWDTREIKLTGEYAALFQKYEIPYLKEKDIKPAFIRQVDEAFFERMLHLLKMTLQMRNSITGTETDYLISPVANSEGYFFDSRTAPDTLPQNADANGAYNIARKGLWAIEQIRTNEDPKKLKLAISNKEWLEYAQNFRQ
jgi:CRISPR-associated protein Cpf1